MRVEKFRTTAGLLLLGVALLVFADIAQGQVPQRAVTPPSNPTPTCYFSEPTEVYHAFSNFDGGYDRPKASYYANVGGVTWVPFDIGYTDGTKSVPGLPATFTLKWKSSAGGFPPLKSDPVVTPLRELDGYRATLMSPGRPDGSNAIPEHSVAFEGSESVTLGNQGFMDFTGENRATYTLKITNRDGVPITSCSVIVTNASNIGYLGNIHATQKFPSGGNYPIQIGSSTTTANYNYAPPISEITVDERAGFRHGSVQNFGLNLSLGQFARGIYFGIASYAVPLGEGRWDISDPMNPVGPDFVHVGKGLGKGRGPLADGAWGHEPMFTSDIHSVAESAEGEARMFMVFGSNVNPLAALGWDLGSRGYFGQQVDPDLRGDTAFKAGVIDATQSGNYFLYYPGPTKVSILDLSSLSGSAAPPFLKEIGSVGWTGITELEVIRDAASQKHFLLGRGGTPEKPVLRLGEIDPDTGRILRPKVLSLALGLPRGLCNVCNYYGPASNIQSFAVGNRTYLIMPENFKTDEQYSVHGDLTLGLYRLDVSNTNLVKVSTITVKDMPFAAWSTFQITPDLNGAAYPVLTTLKAKYSKTGMYWVNSDEHLAFYGLKSAFSKSSVEFSNPDFVISEYNKPGSTFKVGDLVLNTFPYQSFLKNEGGKINMYFYRPAFLHVGSRTYPDAPYEVYVGGGGTFPIPNRGFRGDASLRVDQFDVTSIASGVPGTQASSPFPPITTFTPPVSTPSIPTLPPLSTGDECVDTFRDLCDEVSELRDKICKLAPTLALCQNR